MKRLLLAIALLAGSADAGVRDPYNDPDVPLRVTIFYCANNRGMAKGPIEDRYGENTVIRWIPKNCKDKA